MYSLPEIQIRIVEAKEKILWVLQQSNQIVKKLASGRYLVRCLLCSKEFEVKQYNFKRVPKLCPTCSDSGSSCCGCGSKQNFGRIFCESCARSLKKTDLWGHKKQGQKIRGDKNPSKRADVRKKISAGVLQSYIMTPGLRESRGQNHTWISGFRSRLEQQIAEQLRNWGIPFIYEFPVHQDHHTIYPDFVISGQLVLEIAGWILDGFGCSISSCIERYQRNVEILSKKFKHVILVVPEEFAGAFVGPFQNKNTTVVAYPEVVWEKTQTIFRESICNVDYTHFLSFHQKACRNVHGHTSWNVGAVVTGFPKQGMVIDFGDLKFAVQQKIQIPLDHKFVVPKGYVVEENGDLLTVEYSTDGFHQIILPKTEVYLFDEEPTCENLTRHFAQNLLSMMPSNVIEVGVAMREGVNNGAISFVERPIRLFGQLEQIIRYHLEVSQ